MKAIAWAAVLSAGLLARTGAEAEPREASQPVQTVVNNVVTSQTRPAMRIAVAPDFVYAGGQRFTIRVAAEAEQHIFVDAGPDRSVKRMYWIQLERFLDGRVGEYSYAEDEPLVVGPFTMRAHVRRFTEPPAADSDRRRAWELVERAGYRMPAVSTRARLVYVPESDRRREVMIIYLEPSTVSAPPAADEGQVLLRRALDGVTLR